jgi:hypothetical protein
MKYKCISADSHLEIRPDRYTVRVPQKFRDRAPKVITLEDGTLAVLQEGQPLERLISNISCGVPYEERRLSIRFRGSTMRNRREPARLSNACANKTRTVSMPKCYFPATSGRVFGVASATTTLTKPSCAPTTIGSPMNIAHTLPNG